MEFLSPAALCDECPALSSAYILLCPFPVIYNKCCWISLLVLYLGPIFARVLFLRNFVKFSENKTLVKW